MEEEGVSAVVSVEEMEEGWDQALLHQSRDELVAEVLKKIELNAMLTSTISICTARALCVSLVDLVAVDVQTSTAFALEECAHIRMGRHFDEVGSDDDKKVGI